MKELICTNCGNTLDRNEIIDHECHICGTGEHVKPKASRACAYCGGEITPIDVLNGECSICGVQIGGESDEPAALDAAGGIDGEREPSETLDVLKNFVNEISSDEYCESVHTMAAHAAFARHLATEMEDAKSGGRDEIWMHDMQDVIALQLISDKLSELASYFDALQKKASGITKGIR